MGMILSLTSHVHSLLIWMICGLWAQIPYVDSPHYRPRAQTVTAGPEDNWITIIEDAVPGTEVLLLDGLYDLDQYAVVVGDEVTVRSQSGNRDAVIIQGQGYGICSEGFLIAGAGITIAELTMTQIRNHAIAIKPDLGAQAPHLYNLDLYDIGTQHIKLSPGACADGLVAWCRIGYTPGGVQGDYINAIDLHEAVDWVIRDNVIYNIAGDGTGCEVDCLDCSGNPNPQSYISGPAILVWNQSSGTLIERNLLIDNFRNISLGLGSGHTQGTVRNNFIYRSGPGDAGIELRAAQDESIYHNTVIVGSYPGAIEVQNSAGIDIANNLISAPIWDRGGASFLSRSNIEDATDADLAVAGEVHIPADSRAIGAGVDLPAVTEDIDGQARDGRWDVGADQFVDASLGEALPYWLQSHPSYDLVAPFGWVDLRDLLTWLETTSSGTQAAAIGAQAPAWLRLDIGMSRHNMRRDLP